ncbi:hypothetical protein [Paraburkholderia phenazinium]|nr:hypothetical protein [Paraburkholderia phenazinium]
MLKKFLGSTMLASILIVSPAFSASTPTLSFSTKYNVLSLYSGEKNLGRFSNVLVSNPAMSSDVEKSVTGSPVIRIITDGSRDKYDITIPIIEVNGVAYTNCAYKSVFDSNDENRSVGVSCSLVPLRNFDPNAAVTKEHLIQYRKEFNWLRNDITKDCKSPLGIEYGKYHVVLCTAQSYPDASKEITMVFDENGIKIFSVRGYELIPGGISDGEFALVGTSGDRVLFHVNSLECIVPREISKKIPSRIAMIGKYNIRYYISNLGKCVYGSYMYENKGDRINFFGILSDDSMEFLELTNNENISGLFNLSANLANLKGNWLSVPSGKIFPVE